ncbi:MAG: cytochrome c family protein [Hyphomicrobiaceae bacterium]
MERTLRLAISIAVIVGATPAWAQDPNQGALVFNQCRACHAIGPGARNKAGPALNGIVGRKAASVPGFNYSKAMKEAAAKGLIWNEQSLSAYLESPDTFLPNGVMAFGGVKNEGDLKNLIAYLKTQN